MPPTAPVVGGSGMRSSTLPAGGGSTRAAAAESLGRAWYAGPAASDRTTSASMPTTASAKSAAVTLDFMRARLPGR